VNQFSNDKKYDPDICVPGISYSDLPYDVRRIIYAESVRQIYRTSQSVIERENRIDQLADELGLLLFKRKDNDRCSREW